MVKLVVDKNLKFTPCRPLSKSKVVYPDHYSLILSFKDIPLKANQIKITPKFTIWNTNKTGGWESYKDLTENNAKLMEVAEDFITNDPDKMMKTIDTELNKVKFVSFGKVKVRQKKKSLDILESLQKDKIKCFENENGIIEEEVKEIDSKIAEHILKEQRIQFEKEIECMKNLRNTKGKSALIFNLKEKVVGPKKAGQEATVLNDPKTKNEVNSPDGIKKVSIDYCADLLTNRDPKHEYLEDLEFKQIIHEIRMNEHIKDDLIFTKEIFDKSLKMLKLKNGNKYDFILKSGQALKLAIFNLFRVVWENEKKPDVWRNTVLIQLFKGSGSCQDMNSYRNIHTKLDIPKFFGHIVTTAAKPALMENMSKYQIGTKPGHRAQEHLFVIKSVMGLYELLGKALIMQFWDISKYFDRESLVDGLNELYKNNVKGKLYKLLYEMNKDTRIVVRTPVGDTEQREVGEGWGQGTIEGAIVSAVNLDNGVRDFFDGSEYELSYGDIVLAPALFQDDVSRMCDDPASVQMGNDRMEAMAETKLLDFNMTKSCMIVIGKPNIKKEMEAQLLVNPPKLYGQNMKQSNEEKYLGEMINSGGLSDSVTATVAKRTGRVLQAIFEIRTVIDDCRSHVIGGLVTALEIWEMAVIPYVTSNCEMWVKISAKTIQKLDKLQDLSYRVLLQVPTGCPIPVMYWDCGGMLMEYRIVKKKLMFLHHLANLDDSSLAKQVYDVQLKLGLPGLIKECEQYLVKFGVIDITKYTKIQWKNLVNQNIAKMNRECLLDKMKSYSKLDQNKFAEEKFELKPYLKNLQLTQARQNFRIRSFMTRLVKMNFPSDRVYSSDLWSCWHCPNIDTQAHIRHCPAYQHLRMDKNLDNDMDLVKFFQEVIKLRESLLDKI